MNKQKTLLVILIVSILILLVPLAMAKDTQVPTFQSPLLPWCNDTGGVQPCLPWRPTPPPVTPTPETADADQMHYVFLPIVMK